MRQILPIQLVLAIALPAFGDNAEKPTKRSFEVMIESEMKMEGFPGMDPLNTVSRFRYTCERSAQKAVLAFEEVQIDVKMDGKDFLSSLISRTRFRYSPATGKGFDYSSETAPQKVKAMLEESYGAPIVALALDANGKETGRTMLGSKIAQQVIGRGMLANARAFHPPFYQGKENWDAPIEVGASVGGSATGNLHYEKQSTAKGRVKFKVSGELKLDELKASDGKWKVNGKHTVIGEQIYDEAKQEWISGEWKTTLILDGESEGKRIATGKGKMVLKMKMVE